MDRSESGKYGLPILGLAAFSYLFQRFGDVTICPSGCWHGVLRIGVDVDGCSVIKETGLRVGSKVSQQSLNIFGRVCRMLFVIVQSSSATLGITIFGVARSNHV